MSYKPHIRLHSDSYQSELWQCAGIFNDWVFIGYGRSPALAYQHWWLLGMSI